MSANKTNAPRRLDWRFTLSPFRSLAFPLWIAIGLCLGPAARAEIQFDMFPGFQGALAERSWNPIVFELSNDGDTVNGEIHIQTDRQETQIRVPIELPPNTTKRISLPVFAHNSYPTGWSAELREGGGRLASTRPNGILMVPESIPLVGSLPQSAKGGPTFPGATRQNQQQYLSPVVRELQIATFPDSKLALQGLDTLYLHSSRADEFEAPQIEALLGWINSGGHLVVAMDQAQDLTAAPWLQRILPMAFERGAETGAAGSLFREWVIERATRDFRRFNHPVGAVEDLLTQDFEFEEAEFVYLSAVERDGDVLLQHDGAPLVVRAQRGRGAITVLAFSPEIEPFLSWELQEWFWPPILGVSADWFHEARSRSLQSNPIGAAHALDAAFGSMIDSRQVKKLPIGWLIALLIVYLVVIGPLDHYILKRIRRPMLTWITFPLYVAFFSALIYYIGYRLRAGETEWNETQIVDVLIRDDEVDLHGFGFHSIYSPINRNYPLKTEGRDAGVRSETSTLSAQANQGALRVRRQGPGFESDVFVPVWTSRLVATEWLETGPLPIYAEASRVGGSISVKVENRSEFPFADVWIAYDSEFYQLGAIEAQGQRQAVDLSNLERQSINNLVTRKEGAFASAANSRQDALGSSAQAQVTRELESLLATSFLNWNNLNSDAYRSIDNPSSVWTPKLERFTLTNSGNTPNIRVPGYGRQEISVLRDFDVSNLVARGEMVIFAYVPDFSAMPGLNQFNAKRSTTETIFRLAVRVPEPTSDL